MLGARSRKRKQCAGLLVSNYDSRISPTCLIEIFYGIVRSPMAHPVAMMAGYD